MKKIFIAIVLLFSIIISSCTDDFVKEEPIDFLSSNNAYKTYTDFNASIYNLYDLVRSEFYNSGERRPFDYMYGCDIVYDGQPSVERHTNMVAAYAPTGNVNIALNHWQALYKIVAEANTVISRAPGSQMTDGEKTLTEARARFFRALAYRTLVYLYGGVPLSLEEVTAPKADYVRASKAEVLAQVIEDLKFSTQNLPEITAVQKGEISNLVANHLLAEVYISAGEYQNAVDAATTVINNPNVKLMTSRFGRKSSDTSKDVYWDLFQQGNQNDNANKEALWVIQFETDLPGGGVLSTTNSGSYQLERNFGPQFNNFKINNVAPILYPRSDYSGGRGIGWAISTKYFSNTIWESDFDNDIRNANHNFVREFEVTNPKSPLYGQTISTENPPAGIVVPNRYFYAFQSKITTPGDHPDNIFQDKGNMILSSKAGATYADQYMFRLAETYLLRAEAYLGLEDQQSAADDINMVRSRSNANDVDAGEVDIDYILDERMRELGVEEKRRLTLMRLGLWYDRVKKCNPYYEDALPTYNVWPIPAAEIERNNKAKLDQNLGYPE